MRGVVRLRGSIASVRIPAAVLREANLRPDQPVDIRAEQGRILVEPLPDAAPDIDALIDAITPENRHDPVDFGPPVGGESL
ncbi:AbrB/MazE/SpoVT family DNA-binding domain-containing protein [uncultured Rhodospira sp.]|uniref:AbrB/MazE/SpoVT family DNA-binding domain-containing protein n=1 Tax=uncultured Rhodospira sp. TaxID=1936189 RepID=UPI00262C2033|nr:AbrB/MazE/SpoVT family DNA-binding domain-containing protein [uncultured Rhodospira sp.]